MPWLLEWMLYIGLTFIGFGLLGGSALNVRKRPHFWIRVLFHCLAMVAAVLVLYFALELKLLPQHVLMLFWLVLVVGALIVTPVSCYRAAGSPPGSSDEEDGGGGGGADPLLPRGPRGGIPLLDAMQSDTRVRDHTRHKLHEPTPRRPIHPPQRAPARLLH